jgi:preprotein translocase subunit SecE
LDFKLQLEKVKQFYHEVRVELRKITWPPRKETMASTSVVLIIVIIVACFLGVVDFSLSEIVKKILS